MTPGLPALDDILGGWLDRDELVHLHSLRNQWGQAHVNPDLTSLSWLAIPPYSVGYHTGVLRVDGHVWAAQRFRWAPWGVDREAANDDLVVRSTVSMAYEATRVLWRIEVSNASDQPRQVALAQDLLAAVGHSEVDWGWTYGTPWSRGNYHDFHATERIRAETIAEEPREAQLLPAGARPLRLGRARLPGIQRDEDGDAMLIESALPDHSTTDVARDRQPAVIGSVTEVALTSPTGERTGVRGPYILASDDAEWRLPPVVIEAGARLDVDFVLVDPTQTGVILTHGNHADSLQVGLRSGRPSLTIGGEHVEAAHKISAGAHRLSVAVDNCSASLCVDGTQVARTTEWWRSGRWRASDERGVIVIDDTRSPASAAYAVVPSPSRLTVEDGRAVAEWRLSIEPGSSQTVWVTLELGVDRTAILHRAAETARDGEAALAAVADRWRRLWINTFVAGNDDHSGYLPVLDTERAGLARTYYTGILLAIYLRNTGVSRLGPVFLTGGPRLGPTTTFFWDLSEWARTASMLEPVGMRAWIVAALGQPYDRSHSFDTRHLLPVGNHYAANEYALFRCIQAYIGVTGDVALLAELVGARTVIDHLRQIAIPPDSARAAYAGGILFDFGDDPWELLECVPNYRHAVVAFNAASVGMLRALAWLERRFERPDEATALTARATELATAVRRQYAGGGRWRIAHPAGNDVIGHCLDFQLVAAEMADDLEPRVAAELADFAEGVLIDGDWMHALAPDDPIAPFADRPDHGASGAFAGWPGATAYGLVQLGRTDAAAEFLGRLHRSTSGAVWGQAVEAIGAGRYRVAERGASNRESSAGVAATEAIIAGLFGIRAVIRSIEAPRGVTANRFGTLRGVRAVGFDLPAASAGWYESVRTALTGSADIRSKRTNQ
ncbi:MAG TPA: hypothetical protein VNM34_05990 [Verrucomicrobiae bacterium]|nr:hypothetical protein [Verrucomicrobiae bacterium]